MWINLQASRGYEMCSSSLQDSYQMVPSGARQHQGIKRRYIMASILNIDAKAFTAALKYFNNLAKITELVHFSYSLRSDTPLLAVAAVSRQRNSDT